MTKLIIFDWNRTLFDPATQSIYPQALPLINELRENRLVLVSTAEISNPYQFLKNAKLDLLFSEIIIGKEKLSLFKSLRSKYCLIDNWVVGDRLDSEILAGNAAGFSTIRVRQGKYSGFTPKSAGEKPNFEVDNLLDCLPILSS